MLKAANKDLEILEIFKNHLWKDENVETWLTVRKRRRQRLIKTIETIIKESERNLGEEETKKIITKLVKELLE